MPEQEPGRVWLPVCHKLASQVFSLVSTHGIPIADDRRKGPLCARTVTPFTKPPTRWIDVPSPVKSVEFNR